MAIATKGLRIGGEWASAGTTFTDLNPANGEIFAAVPDATRMDAVAAIDAAHAAVPDWAALTFDQRARHMLEVARVLEARQGEIAEALVAEGGAWFGKGMFETGYVPGIYRAAAAQTYAPIGEVLPSDHGKVSMVVRQPLGVVCVISPWNFPLLLSSRGIAFAIAAGNTVVLKPSEETPYTGGLVLAEVFEEAGVPEGVLNVITCSRERVVEVGSELVEHPKVKAVSFTGSTAVGKQIAAKAGAHLKRYCLELGGKDALIVCDDADIERATAAASFGAFMHQGQICMSVEKVLVQRPVAGEFLRRFVERAARLKMGDPGADKANVIGPIINARQVEKIRLQVEDAVAKGAKVALGGGIDGLFVEPTILTDVTPGMRVFQEETFGPVAPVLVFDTDEEAIALANDSEYGLSSGVVTRDEHRGLDIARRLETGMCHVNCSPVNDEPHIPFGGSKSSGVGRHGGRWSTETFTETRWVTLERGGRPFPPMF
jgi:aldehyde dehydrogenase (NAD+)